MSPRPFRSLVRLALVAGALVLLAGCGEKQTPARADKVPAGTEAAPGTQPVQAESKTQIVSWFRECASKFVQEVGKKDVRVAVLPFDDFDGHRTALSDWLAETFSSALAESGVSVVERSKLSAILQERDLAQALGPGGNAKILKADDLFIGRYSLAAENVTLTVKAVDANDSRCVLSQDHLLPADKSIRALAFAGQSSAPVKPDSAAPAKVWEENGFVMVSARYNEANADQLRLLDRVRQLIRERLFDYARQVLAVDPGADLEDWFKKGDVTNCKFDGATVDLTMKFTMIGGAKP